LLHRPELIQTSAALSWGTAAAMSFTDLDGRIFLCALTGAAVSSMALMTGSAARLYTAMTKAAITRPPYDAEPPVLLEDYRQRGRHASRAR
jgi:hypothetical protein